MRQPRAPQPRLPVRPPPPPAAPAPASSRRPGSTLAVGAPVTASSVCCSAVPAGRPRATGSAAGSSAEAGCSATGAGACRGTGHGRRRPGGVESPPAAGDEAALLHGLGHDPAHQGAAADGVVVPRDRVLDQVRVTVGVDHGNDRDADLVGLRDRDVLFFDVDDEHGVGQAGHVPDTAKVALELFQFSASG